MAAGWCAEDDERVVADVPHEACTEAAGHGLPSLRSEHIDAERAQNRFVVGVEHCDGLRPLLAQDQAGEDVLALIRCCESVLAGQHGPIVGAVELHRSQVAGGYVAEGPRP